MRTAMSARTSHEVDVEGASPARTEEQLLERYAREGGANLEAELVDRFMPLARSLAMRYRNGAEDLDDLVQVASLALVKALRRYDPSRGRRFAAYAAPTILGELRRHFRDHTWRLHMPRRLQEGSMAVERAMGELAEGDGRSPTVAEIAEHLETTEEHVLEVLQARATQRSWSLDAPVRLDEPESATTIEIVGQEDPGFDSVEAQHAAEHCSSLEERELQVIELRFVEDLKQNEIGARLGISQMQVSRLLRRGLAKLLEAVQGEESPDGERTFRDARPDPRLPKGRMTRRRRRRGAARPSVA